MSPIKLSDLPKISATAPIKLGELKPIKLSNLPPVVDSSASLSNDTGFFSSLAEGFKKGRAEEKSRDKILKQLIKGERPTSFAKREETPDLEFSRKSLGQNIGKFASEMIEPIAATAVGAGTGATIAGPIGGVAGAFIGGGTAGAKRAYADYYRAAIEAGKSPDEALAYAKKQAILSGLVEGVGSASGGVGAAGKILPYAAKQTGIQGALSGAQQLGSNILHKKEIDPETDISEGVASSAAFGAAMQAPIISGGIKAIKGIKKGISNNRYDKILKVSELPPASISTKPIKLSELPLADKGNINQLPSEKFLKTAVKKAITAGEEFPEIVKKTGRKIEISVPTLEDLILAKKELYMGAKTQKEKSAIIGNTAREIQELVAARKIDKITPDLGIIKNKLFGETDVKIPLKEKVGNIKGKFKDINLQDSIFESFTPIRHLEEQLHTNNKLPIPRNSELPVFRAAKLSRHTAGPIEYTLTKGGIKIGNEGLTKSNTPSLENVFSSLKSTEDLKNFESYLYARRVKEQGLYTSGKEKNLNPIETLALINLEKTHPHFKEAARKLDEYNKNLLDFSMESGLISKEQHQAWSSEGYVPFFRNKDENVKPGEIIRSPSALSFLKKLTGGKQNFAIFDKEDRYIGRVLSEKEAIAKMPPGGRIEEAGPKTNPILENIVTNTSGIIDRGIKNRAALKAISLLKENSLATKVPVNRASDPLVIKLKENGKDSYYKIHDEPLYKAVKSIIETQNPNLTAVSKTIQSLTSLKNFASKSMVLEPVAQVSIGIKDVIQSAIINANGGFFKHLKSLPSSIADSYRYIISEGKKGNKDIEDMIISGADIGFFKRQPKEVRDEFIRNLETREKRTNSIILTSLDNIYRYSGTKLLLNTLTNFGKAAEMGSRLNIYRNFKEKGIKTAAFEAVDYLDYNARGNADFVNLATKLIPFLGSRLSDMHKLGRALSNETISKTIYNSARLVAGISMANAIVNLSTAFDDPDPANGYMSLPEYERDGYMCFDLYKYLGKRFADNKLGGKRWLKIPKPWTVGFLFMTIPERLIQTAGGDADASSNLKAAYRMLTNTFGIDITANPATKAIVEGMTGMDSYRNRPIVPTYLSNLEPELQYDINTSETAKKIGSTFNISPMKVEHLASTFTGSMWMLPAFVIDGSLEAAGIINSNPENKLNVFRRGVNLFLKDNITSNSAYVNELMSSYNEGKKAYLSMKAYEDQVIDNKTALIAESYEKEKAEEIDNYRFLKKDYKDIKELRKEMNDILSSNLPKEQKAELLKEIRNEINQIGYLNHQ